MSLRNRNTDEAGRSRKVNMLAFSDLISSMSTAVTVGGHDDNFLEMWDF